MSVEDKEQASMTSNTVHENCGACWICHHKRFSRNKNCNRYSDRKLFQQQPKTLKNTLGQKLLFCKFIQLVIGWSKVQFLSYRCLLSWSACATKQRNDKRDVVWLHLPFTCRSSSSSYGSLPCTITGGKGNEICSTPGLKNIGCFAWFCLSDVDVFLRALLVSFMQVFIAFVTQEKLCPSKKTEPIKWFVQESRRSS